MGGFSLILALAFLVWFLVINKREKSRTNAAREQYSTERDRDERRLNEWLAKVTDKGMESRIEDGLYHMDDTLIQEVKDSWQYYFSEDAPSRFENTPPKGKYDNIETSSNSSIQFYTAFRILMANRGKLLYNDALYGIPFVATGPTHLEEDKKMDRYIRFFFAMNSKLAKSNARDEMFSNIQEYSGFDWRPIDSKNKYYSGIVKWKAAIPMRELDKAAK